MMEILEKLKPNGIAMEIGCGSGLLSIALANNWEIESCDVNPFAVSAAKKTLIPLHLQIKLILQNADLARMSLIFQRTLNYYFGTYHTSIRQQ